MFLSENAFAQVCDILPVKVGDIVYYANIRTYVKPCTLCKDLAGGCVYYETAINEKSVRMIPLRVSSIVLDATGVSLRCNNDRDYLGSRINETYRLDEVYVSKEDIRKDYPNILD